MSLAWVWSQYKGVLSETGVTSPHPQNTPQQAAWIWSHYRGVQAETSPTPPVVDDEISLAWVWCAFKGVTTAYDATRTPETPKLSSPAAIESAPLEAGAVSTPSGASSLLFYLGLIALSVLFSLLSKIDYPTPSLPHSASKSHDASCASAPDANLSAILYVQKLAERVDCD
ncbi:MAG: hypothetical protein EBS82_05550 [Methylocystaceae bacterium]|jgi:hypothetical protein|nr:hypothetical protein [Methylocystaceae bacterium]